MEEVSLSLMTYDAEAAFEDMCKYIHAHNRVKEYTLADMEHRENKDISAEECLEISKAVRQRRLLNNLVHVHRFILHLYEELGLLPKTEDHDD